jgi:hypothetical protein
MSALKFSPVVTADQAWTVVRAKAPGLVRGAEELQYHPFSAFVHTFAVPKFRNPRRQERMNTLVDRYTGKAFITDPWPELEPVLTDAVRNEVSDPGWNSTSFEAARRKAARLVGTVAVRHLRLAQNPRVKELESHELVWKPNWLLSGQLQNRSIKILVDALNGGYYVVGS